MTLSRLKPNRFAPRAVALDALLVLLVGLSLVSTATAQNFLRLSPAQVETGMGASDVALELEIDFSEVTVGGGVEVTYDATRLEFVSFTFSQDPNFGRTGPADGDPTQPLEVGAGWFPLGVSGLHTIGTFLFRPIGSGSASVSTAQSPMIPGPYVGPSSTPLVVSHSSATINVLPAVPALGVLGRLVCCALLFLIAIRIVSQQRILGGSPPGLRE